MAIKFKHVDGEKKDVQYAPSKRHLPKWQWYLLGLVLFSPVAYFVIRLSIENIVVTAPGYILFHEINVRSPENGYLESLDVSEGEEIKKGKIVAHFASPEIDQTIRYLKNEINILEELKQKDKNTEIARLNQLINATERYLEESLSYYEGLKKFRDRGMITVLQLNTALKDLHAAKTQLSELQRQITISKKRHVEHIESSYNEKIRQLQYELAKTLAIQHLFVLKSPVNGAITYIPTHAYEQVTKNQILIHINDHDELRIKAFLDAKHVDEVSRGQVVTITLPDRKKISGTIINTPNLARVEPGASKIIKTGSNKIELIIKPTSPITTPYRVHNIPVKVTL